MTYTLGDSSEQTIVFALSEQEANHLESLLEDVPLSNRPLQRVLQLLRSSANTAGIPLGLEDTASPITQDTPSRASGSSPLEIANDTDVITSRDTAALSSKLLGFALVVLIASNVHREEAGWF